MLTTLTLPALAFLMAVSGIPGLNALPGFRGLLHHKPKAAVVDTLPPVWRPAPRRTLDTLSLRDGLPMFGRAPGSIMLTAANDPRKVTTSVDPDSGFWTSRVEIGDVRLGSPFRRSLSGYGSSSMEAAFADKWRQTSRDKINIGGSALSSQRQGLSLPIPVQLPSVVSSVLGPGGPALNVSGSENIRLSGTSDWSNAQTVPLGARKSLFPSLDMQQDLNIQLEGQLSDRVKVNLLQNSANQVPLANRIAINYHGEEDDLVQELDLGNTSLALPGTQYVSYSGRNEGLFGVKLATRVGPLDFTALASKQEGKSERASYTGGSSLEPHKIQDIDYDKGRYFILYDPQYALMNVEDSDIRIYLDDGNYGNDVNYLRAAAMVDPGRRCNVPPLGGASDTVAFRGHFDLLQAIDDYEILPDYYRFDNGLSIKIIRLKQPLASDMCLAASYVARRVQPDGSFGAPDSIGFLGGPGDEHPGEVELKMLRPPKDLLHALDATASAQFDPTAPFDAVRELEMKNFYSLQGFQIDPQGFKLAIQKGTDQPPVVYVPLPGGGNANYLEVLGLDNLDESQASPRAGHDEKVDGTAYVSGRRVFVDYTNGVLWFPDLRPFAPRVHGASMRTLDSLVSLTLNRRIALTGTSDSVNTANNFYDMFNPQLAQASRYLIVAQFAAQRGGGDITLGRGNILSGSDVVTVNGERWTRDRDYSIDYDLGRVTLKRSLGATDQLNIDYSYAPLFAQASKTLLGSAFRVEGRDRSLGGAFLYESQGAQDLRPRLGEEPSRTLITDVNTEWRFRPSFLTRAIDRLPGVRTTSPSDLTVQAEVGASFPNPNTKNEVYIDDMEGVRDAVSLSLAPERWRLMSIPSRKVYDAVGGTSRAYAISDTTRFPRNWNAELHWYMPPNVVKEKDLKPTLSDAQGGRNPHQILALSVPRFPTTVRPDSVWAGLTYVLDEKGVDISRSQFIELWVNDFRDRHDPALDDGLVRRDSLRLHIDIGVVSEDALRAPNRQTATARATDPRLADGKLQSEDIVPRDHQLTVSGGVNEDTGYDGIDDDGEKSLVAQGKLSLADLVTANGDDPEGDDYDDPSGDFKDIDPRKWRRTNGSDGNKRLYPYPDTEDLNLNDNLDTDERYYEYTINLGQPKGVSPYLIDDVSALRDSLVNHGQPTLDIAEDNGWRRYRIPLNDKLREAFGAPDLTNARHVRVWIDGLTGPDPSTGAVVRPMLEIGGLDIVGSRWVSTDLTPAQQAKSTTITLNSVNSVDNAEVYRAPFDPGQTLNGSQILPRREQSMSLEFNNLDAGDALEAYRTFSIDEDYTRYGALTWYAASYDLAGYAPTPTSKLFYFVRFSSDERGDSYYEIKRKLPINSTDGNINWEKVTLDLAELSRLKLDTAYAHAKGIYRVPYGPDGDSVIVKGRPSFTRLRRISFGLANDRDTLNVANNTLYPRGQLWFDELRAADVKKDVGYANRLLASGHLANVASYNVSWSARDADFLSVGETRGSGSRSSNLAITGQFDTHRFFEGTGIQLPVSYVYNENALRPRFSAGDDIVRSGAQQEASKTRTITRSVNTSYSRTWSERSNPYLRYTLGGLTANAGLSENHTVSPTGLSRSVSTNAAVNWSIGPRSLLPIKLPGTKLKAYPLPERIYWNWNQSRNSDSTFTRSLDTGSLTPSSGVSGRIAGLSMGMDTRPIDIISHHIDVTRSLSLANVSRQDRVAGLNLGRPTAWRQSLNARLGLARGAWLQPNMTWSTNFNSMADLQSRDLSVHGVGNGQNVSVNWALPFDQLKRAAAARPAAAPPPPPTGATPDSTAAAARPKPKRSGSLGWRDLLARLGAVQTDASFGRSSAYSRILGQPTLLYSLGLVDDPGLGGSAHRAALDPSNSSQTGLEWRTNARTRVPLAFGSAVQLRFSLGDRSNTTNGVSNRSSEARFPDLDLEYGRIADAVHLTRFVRQPTLRTSWVHSTTADYRGTRDHRTGRSSTNDFHPLLSVRGSLRNGAQADLSVNVRNTLREMSQFGTSTTTDNNTDLNFTLSKNYTAGQKIKVLGKTKTVRSSGSLQLATVYSHHTGHTEVAGSRATTRPIDDTRMSVTGTGNYGFSNSVTGSAVLGFSQQHDNTLDNLRRSVRVELRAQFSF